MMSSERAGRAGLLAALILAGAVPAGRLHAETPAPTAGPTARRYEHAVEVAALTRPYLNAKGFLDQDFPETVAHPSPYYTDFFGIQAIADVPAAEILADLTPGRATLVSKDEHSLTLAFPKGYTATFYPLSNLKVLGLSTPRSHVAVSGGDWRAIDANLSDLVATLKAAGLARKYLVPNPFYAMEKATDTLRRSGRAATVVVDPDLKRFDATPNAILLMGEAVHGHAEDAERLTQIMAAHKVDWLGMEMLGPGQQPDLDAFYRAKPGSAAYAAARKRLVDYFASAWNGRAGPHTTGEGNYYFQLVEAARRHGVRVVGLEASTTDFILFRYGETDFGGSVRSGLWARTAPKTGRGVVFGGSAHFYSPGTANVQDAIAARDPGRTFVSLKPIQAPPKPS